MKWGFVVEEFFLFMLVFSWLLFNVEWHFLSMCSTKKWKNNVFKEGGIVPLRGELPLWPLGVVLLGFVGGWCTVSSVGADALVLFRMRLWWDGWAPVLSSKEVELVWSRPVFDWCMVPVLLLGLPMHSGHAHPTRSDMGFFSFRDPHTLRQPALDYTFVPGRGVFVFE